MLFRHFVNVGTTCFSALPGSILAKFTVDLARYLTLGFKSVLSMACDLALPMEQAFPHEVWVFF